ncbi:MAG TPA: LysR family transcriptional regulator [Polyangiaceae bacterium]|nr:LysR family transcriptional regulator [Polyangiaceae bacterium]
METALLQVFLDVVKRGGFAAVARDSNVDPSSISRAIASLESELGARLFQRTTRKLTLTEAGESFLGRVAPLVEELERAREEVASIGAEPHGTLRVTSSVAFGQICLVPLLPAFRRAFPRLRLELLMTDQNLDLLADRIDLAIRLAPSYRGDVVGSKLFPTRYRVAASPAYLAREGTPKSPRDLSVHRCLLFPLPEFRERWLFRRGGALEEVPVQGNLVLSTALALRSAALDGLGPVLLADWHLDEDFSRGRLVDLFPHHEVTATTFDTAAWLLYPSRSYLPHKVRSTIEFLRKHLGKGAAKRQQVRAPK